MFLIAHVISFQSTWLSSFFYIFRHGLYPPLKEKDFQVMEAISEQEEVCGKK